MSVNDPRFSGQPAAAAAVFAAVAAIIGIGDSLYLTVHHYTAEPVPCTVTGGCETVLTSAYAEFLGIPIAAFGAAAYFVAFSLAILAAFGNSRAWLPFKVLSTVMVAFSAWLFYLQAFVIKAFCQFCLVSAGTSALLFLSWAVPAVVGLFRKERPAG